jgi:NADH-quinone oxidoreductase subunit I
MFGLGIVKGLGITLKHFVNTFIDDLKYFPGGSTRNPEAFARRQGPTGAGLFTVEYPEMKLQPPENFRFIPFLITDYAVPKDDPAFDRAEWLEQNRCTSCGICAKVCPPQCIWIVRTNDPKTGKPIPQPAEFYIDTDICMNCGYCAEFCPFDAIKMDHDFELADYEREVGHVHDLDRLLKPITYYAAIRPTWYAKEEAARRAEEEERRRKEEEKQRQAAERAAAQAAQAELEKTQTAAKSTAEVEGKAETAQPRKRTPEEIKAQREAMLARKQQRAAEPAGNGASVESQATVNAEPTQATEVLATPPTPDDLTIIEGIGPKIASLLQGVEITTFARLAETDVNRLQQILKEAELQHLANPASWPEQAKLAAAGQWDELKTLQGNLRGGRHVQSSKE